MDNKHLQNHPNPTIPTAQAYTPKLQLDRWHTTFVWWGGAPLSCDIGPGAMIAEACLWVQDYPASEVSHDPKLQEITIYIKLIALEIFSLPEFHIGMDQYLLIPFLGEWTSIYQLFFIYQTQNNEIFDGILQKPFIDLQSPQGRAQHLWYGSGAIMWPMRHRQALRGAFHVLLLQLVIIHHPFWSALASLFGHFCKIRKLFLEFSCTVQFHTYIMLKSVKSLCFLMVNSG